MSGATPPRDDEDDALAAELAFGLLDDHDRRAAEARVAADPAFAATCERWAAHAAGLLTGPDVAPPAHVWPVIAARLPANDPNRRQTRLWQLAIAASLAAGITLGVLVTPRERAVVAPARAPRAPLVALLTGDAGQAVAIAYDRIARRMITTPQGLAPGTGSAELWVIPAGGKPIAIGLVSAASSQAMIPPAAVAAALAPGATLAISIEPAGGSPTGSPTGPVVATGKINAA